MTHAYRSGLKIIRGIKKVNQYNKNKDFIKSWDSIIDVQKQLGISKSSISKYCKKIKQKQQENLFGNMQFN